MKANVVLMDPPWEFVSWSEKGGGRNASRHYKTEDEVNLLDLQLAPIMEKDCAVFMWTTFPNLKQALRLGDHYKLHYSTVAFTWAKLNKRYQLIKGRPVTDNAYWHIGQGYSTRSNAEICLLFTVGKPKRVSAAVRQLIVAPVRKHSQKPDEQYERIERLYEPRIKLELFARQKREGWYCYGNEITGNDISVDLIEFSLLKDEE